MFFYINRVNDGDAFIVATSDLTKRGVNRCNTCAHPGNGFYTVKENFKTLPSSYIVPKGSPLSVSIYTQKN